MVYEIILCILKSQQRKILTVGKDVQQADASYITCGSVNCINYFEQLFGSIY